MRIDFTHSAQATVGIEWELALTSKTTGELVNIAPQIIAEMRAALPAEAQEQIAAELLQNTVELVSSPHRTVSAALAQMQQLCQVLLRVCDRHDVAPIGAGCHPFANGSGQLATASERYQNFMRYHGWWGRNMLIWGVHTHIGVPTKELAIPALNELLVYQPHLIALASSSPFWLSNNTAYASNRTMLFQQLPSAGLPPQLQTWEDFENAIQALKTYNVISEINEARWDIRPAPKWGTVEIRTCDSVSSLEALGAITALSQCLAEEAYRRVRAGLEAATLPQAVRAENKWRAARFGLAAEVIINSKGDTELLSTQLQRVCERLTPIAADLGCAAQLRSVLAIAASNHTSAREQLDTYQEQVTAGKEHSAALTEVVFRLQQQLRSSVLNAA